jgi:hypothetical protein
VKDNTVAVNDTGTMVERKYSQGDDYEEAVSRFVHIPLYNSVSME